MKLIELGKIIVPAKARRAGDADYPILSMTMRDGLVDQADKFKKRIASADTSPYKVVERNQLVVGFPIDEGVLSFQNLYDEAIVSPAYNIWNLHDDATVDSKYLEIFLRSPGALAFYKSKLRSTTARRRSIPNDEFLSLPVPVPPLSEQKRILKLLDEADELRKLRAQADNRTAALLPALFNEMFGDPKANTKGWPRMKLGQEAAVQGGYAFKSQDYVANGVRLVKIANVHFENLSWAETECLPQSYIDTHSAFALREGDILLALTRPIIKSLNSVKVARVTTDDIPCLLNQRVGRFVIKRENAVHASYLQNFCYTDFFKEQVDSFCSVSLQPNVSTEQVESIPFILPPLELQKEFAQRVTEIRELEAIQAASRQRLESLFQSMLHRAFNGEL